MPDFLTPQDMLNGHFDVKSLGEAANGDEDTQVVTRMGQTYPSAKKAIKIMTQAGVGFTSFETKALMTASSLADGTYAIVTNDTSANNGLHLKKSGTWSKVAYDVDERQKEYTSGEINKLDSLIVNEGKRYPLAYRDRQGTSIGPSVPFMDALLDASITNARPNNYYHISYYANGDDTLSPDGNGWLIRRIPIDSYPDGNDSANIIVAYSDAQRQPIGIDTIVLQSKTEEVVSITLDATKLPPRGQSINAGAQGMDGYEYVISPDCYIYTTNSAEEVQQLSTAVSDNLITSQSYANDAKTQAVAIATDVAANDATIKSNTAKSEAISFTNALDALKINGGKIYPFARKTRGGVNIQSSVYWTAAIIDAYVINAKPNYVYQISYYANGDTRVSASEGWSIERATIADYASTGVMQRILRYTEQQPQLTPNSIDTVRLKTEGDETVVITVDTSKLPDRGVPLKAISSEQDGYADIIAPSTYLYTESTGKLTTDVTALTARVDNLPLLSGSMTAKLSSGVLAVAYQSSNRQYRLNFGPNGFNNLPNIIGFDYKTTGDWIVINSGTTDWLPPLAAVANSGDGASLIYTGGNHGSSGNAGGNQTARNVYYDIKIDGKSVTTYDGSCGRIEITIINELMASNTITLNRYAIREAFKVLIVNGVITVDCQRTALEPLVMRTDNGLQSVSTGFNDSYLILNGKTATRQAWSEFDSGAKSLQPKAWSAVIQGSSNQLTSWMDRSYGAGDGRYVADADPFVRRGTGTNTKIYHAIVAGVSLPLAAGQDYKWRGGYHIKAVAEKPNGSDSQFDAIQRVIAYQANDYMQI